MHDRKLHICIVTAAFPALTETFVTTKALELRRRGHTITVIKNNHTGQVNASHLSAVKKSGIKVLTFSEISSLAGFIKSVFRHPLLCLRSVSRKTGEFKTRYKTNRQLALLQKSSYDIVHFEFSGLALTYSDAIKKLTAKTVVSCRGTAEKVKIISQPERVLQLKKLFSLVNAIHCVSADMAATISPYCDSQKVFINRPSVDIDVFKRTRPYKDKNVMVQILSIGRMTFQKGYLTGLMAIKEITKNGVHCTWTIVGDGPMHEEILYHIRALQLTQVVKLAGKKNRNEILDLYLQSDIFFLPSVYEGIANVCLEAMAMELPVVATRCGGMAEVITNKQDGLLADIYDPQSMATALLSISCDFEGRKKMGANARKKVQEQFSLHRQVNEFEEQYYRLIQTGKLVATAELQQV